MAWDREGMREVGNSMNVKPTKKESKEIARKMKMKMESDLPYTMQDRVTGPELQELTQTIL